MVLKKYKVSAFSILLGLFILPTSIFAGKLTKTTLTFYVDPQLTISGFPVDFVIDVTLNCSGTGCPKAGYYGYHTSTFTPTTKTYNGKSYKYYTIPIDRTGLRDISDTGWKINAHSTSPFFNRTAENVYIGGNPIFIVTSQKITKETTDPANGGGTTQGPSIDPTDPVNGGNGIVAAPDDSGPMTGTLPGVKIKIPGLQSAANCDGGTYKSGILYGVSCVGATKDIKTVVQIIKNIVYGFILPTVGVLFLILTIIGGLQYITAAGNNQRMEAAKKTLTAAVIGLLIVVLSEVLIGIFVKLLGGGIV